MSKLKVTLISLIKAFTAPQPFKARYLFIFSLFKSLQYYTPFVERHNEDKFTKYWGHQDIPEILQVADNLFEEEKYIDVYELLNRIKFTQEPEVLWRIARALYNLSHSHSSTVEIKRQIIQEASEIIEVALSQTDTSADVHKWAAVIIDEQSGMVSLEHRVKHSPMVRAHLEKACQLNPRDFSAHYMLGKWCFDMSQLSWFQRMMAKYVLATEPPRSTYQQAYLHLSKAEELRPRTFVPNVYLLGRVCIETGYFYKAKYYLNMTLNLPLRDKCDKCCAEQARNLIKKLDRYDVSKLVLFYEENPFGLND
nr:unnamed protein product [Callosobruchus chinensis]